MTLALALLLTLVSADPSVSIRPLPQTVESAGGEAFSITNGTVVVVPEPVSPILVDATQRLARDLGVSLAITSGDAPENAATAIYLDIDRRRPRDETTPNLEAHSLVIESEAAFIRAAGDAGLLHGLETLRQLAGTGSPLPLLEMADQPDTPVRGVIVEGAPAPDIFNELSRLRCNVVAMRMTGGGQRIGAFVTAFNTARDRAIEPILAVRPESNGWDEMLQQLEDTAERLEPRHLLVEVTPSFFWSGLTALSDARARLSSRLLRLQRTLSGSATMLVYIDATVADDAQDLPANALRILENPGATQEAHLLYVADRQTAYTALDPRNERTLGVWIDYENTSARSMALEKAWNGKSARDPWLHGLNERLGANLAQPFKEEVVKAFAAYLNRRTLAGTSPKTVYREFRRVIDDFAKTYPGDLPDAQLWKDLFDNMAEYVDAEAEFRIDNGISPLFDAAEVVEWLGPNFWDWEEERTRFIIDTMMGKQLFVPSSILFSAYLVPYRADARSSGGPFLEIPVGPHYDEEEHRIDAVFETSMPVAPIARIEFETVGAATMLIEHSADGERWRSVDHFATQQRGGLYPPILIEDPFLASWVRLRVTAPEEQAQLRNARLYAYKPDAEMTIEAASSAPLLDGKISDATWRRIPDAYAFVGPDGNLATRPLAAWIARTDNALWIGGNAAQRDHAETIEVWFTRKRETYRVALTPGGDQNAYETATDGDGFEFAIPWTVLGGKPSRREDWRIDIRRVDAAGRIESRWAPGDITEIRGMLRLR